MNNYELKFLEMQEKLEDLKKLIITDWQNSELHDVEEKLFRKMMDLGLMALEMFVQKKGDGSNFFDNTIKPHKKEDWNYISVFGKLNVPRAYFWKNRDEIGIYPISNEFNLPARHYSYLLQKWNQMIAVDGNFNKATKQLNEILQLHLWPKQSEQINREASKYVDGYYEENPVAEQREPILVVEVDCKGVPMRKEDKIEKKPRLKKGEKYNQKKMSTVTAVFGIERNIRTIDDIVKIEIDNSKSNHKNSDELKLVEDKGPKPNNKHIKATLSGKEVAYEKLLTEIEQRDPNNRCERVVLMDGETALEKNAKKYLIPLGFTIILDLYHVMEKLWILCYFFCKEGSDEAIKWVEKYLIMLLQGKVGYFIGAIRQMIKKRNISKAKAEKIEKILKYYERRKKYMKYNEYIAKGYPIGSGVIEGACRSFVKDRMELSGMRWTVEGAESMLKLRSIMTNGYWDQFWDYFSNKEKDRLYSRYEDYYENLKYA